MRLFYKETGDNSVVYVLFGIPVYIQAGSIKLIGLFDKNTLWFGYLRAGLACAFSLFGLPVWRNKHCAR